MVARLPRACFPTLSTVFIATSAAVAQSTLRGVVIDRNGDPIGQAQVVIGKLILSTGVGRAGDFEFTSIPSGRFVVLRRAIGFEPDRREISFNGRDRVLVEIRLKPAAQRLDSLVAKVDAPKAVSPQMRAFEERRKVGFGRFITRDQLKVRENALLSDVLRMVAGTKFVRRPEVCGGGFALATNRGGEFQWQPWMTCCNGVAFPLACYLTIYLDGVRIWTWGSKEPPRIDEYTVNAFEGIELYRGPAELPVEFQSTGSACGAMLLWSRTGESN